MDRQVIDFDLHMATLHGLFAKQARRQPNAIALVDGDVRLTYRELDLLSNRLANHLLRYRIQPGEAVGILLEKCYEYVVACLAILKAGGAFLHLEQAYPDNFLRQIFADAAPKVVLTKRVYAPRMMAHNVCALAMDDSGWLAAPDTPLHSAVGSDHLAIIGYSSGSTGTPKGVCVSHRATLYAHQQFWDELSGIEEKGRFAYSAFLVWDVLSPLVTGHTGFMVPDEVSFDPQRLIAFFAQHRINHTFLTPSLLSAILQNTEPALLAQQMQTLRVVWVGGEVMTQPLVNETLALLPHLTLINNYGPTECFVITQGKLTAHDPVTPTVCAVGRVLDGMTVLILDEDLRPVPHGEVGELYASGPCLADGYLNNPRLTAEKFVSIGEKLFYKTGDSARFLEDGRLTILGRRDAMLKIRSYNVNLLAIEETLRRHPKVADCVVAAYGESGDDLYLVAYLVASPGVGVENYTCPPLVSYLREQLPFYMVPHVYVALDTLPLSPVSGKLDKSALPRPLAQEPRARPVWEGPALEMSVAAQEELLVALLTELLPHGFVKAEDDFFDLGLHSLLAAQLTTRIREIFGVDLSVAALYQHASVRALVAHFHGQEQRQAMDWQREALLDPDIGRSLDSGRHSGVLDSVLLTGATGFVGMFLLAELLNAGPARRVHCLVRSADRLHEIFGKLQRYGLWQAGFEERIQPLVGDLSRPRLGWSPATFDRHAQEIQAIFHAGAWVNMMYPYQTLKPTNVDGTQEMIRLATAGCAKPLHYISTLGIFPDGNPARFAEDCEIDRYIGQLVTGYSQSKWVAEKLVWQAIERGVPAQIYRIGNIGPDSRTHLANENDTVMFMLDVCRKLRLAPERPDWFFEYTPVDFVARSVVQMAECERRVSPVFHIAGDSLVPATDVFAAMQQRGDVAGLAPMDVWRDNLRALAARQTDPNYSLLEHSLGTEEAFLYDTDIFPMAHFQAQMAQCGLNRPAVGVDYIVRSVFPEQRSE